MQQRTVLIIDDNEDDHDACRRALRRGSVFFETLSAHSGAAGLRILEDRAVDCVLLDYGLPGESGLTVLSAIGERYPFVPVIMMTGYGSEEIAVAAMKSGAADYMSKEPTLSVDVTAKIITAIERARQARKYENQRQEQILFLRTLVHDVRGPLRRIGYFAEAIEAYLDEGRVDAALEDVRSLRSVQATMRDFINTLTKYALLDGDPEFEEIDLNEIVADARQSIGAAASDRSVDFSLEVLPSIWGDAAQLRQVFQNLLSNALKYNKNNPVRIAISTECDDQRNRIIHVNDNGIGIDPQHIETIFQPLKRLHSSSEVEGSGLGLAICAKVMARHNGTIACRSTPGHGSQFVLSFPETPSSAC